MSDHPSINRRHALKALTAAATAMVIPGCAPRSEELVTPTPFRISLAQWSLHRTLFGAETSQERLRGLSGDALIDTLRNRPEYLLRGALDPLDFPRFAQETFGITAVEYVNTFYFGKARDTRYLGELKTRAEDAGVTSVLIMCDLEGDLGAPDTKVRQQSVENHHKWVDAAAFLGCHAIRVNAKSEGTRDEQMRLAADGLSSLADYAARQNIRILVENHGGLSSDADWLVSVMKEAGHDNLGTLPDFGNFADNGPYAFDRYRGVEQLMPYAHAVSAKSLDFGPDGEHIGFDFRRLIEIVQSAGYHGYIGIEFEGEHLDEIAGIRATKALLDSFLPAKAIHP